MKVILKRANDSEIFWKDLEVGETFVFECHTTDYNADYAEVNIRTAGGFLALNPNLEGRGRDQDHSIRCEVVRVTIDEIKLTLNA